MDYDLKAAINDLQRASNYLQESLSHTYKWTREERERLIYCKVAIDAIVADRLK